VLSQSHHVHVAFDHHQPPQVRGMDASLVQTVQLRALMKHRRLRGIEILGRGIAVQRPPAEGDDPAATIADREHDAVAESVARPTLLVAASQAGIDEILNRGAGFVQCLAQVAPAGRRITDPERGGDLAGQPALAQVIDRPLPGRMFAQLLAKETVGLGQPVQQWPERAGAARTAAGLGDVQPDQAGQILNRIRKFQSLVSHQEADGGTVSATAEAVVELLARTDRERRGFFGVKRTAGHEFTAHSTQRHPSVDDLDEIHSAKQLIDEFLRYAASHIHKA
jgi:hypothetical protein